MDIDDNIILEILCRKYEGRQLDPVDSALLGRYLSQNPDFIKKALSESNIREWHRFHQEKDAAFHRFQKAHPEFFPAPQPFGFSRLRKVKWLGGMVAAAALVAAILLIVLQPRPSNTSLSSVTTNVSVSGLIKAVLTLGDQRTINLGEASLMEPITQGNTRIVQETNGQLIYRTGNSTEQPVHNKLTTLTGSNFGVELPDGTKIWLNAGSSLEYPTAFTGPERVVQITGEAYFEVVKKLNHQPFIVKTGNTEIEVLGTCFNVSAYKNDSSIKTTLLEGAVKVRRNNKGKLLSPGQQAVIKGDQLTIRNDMSAEEVIAWKEGYFSFNRLTLSEIMRKLERWYGKPVTYTLGVEDKQYTTYGKIPRTTPLETILQSLEDTNYMHFEIKNDTIIISK